MLLTAAAEWQMSYSCQAPKLTMISITNSKQQANYRADFFLPSLPLFEIYENADSPRDSARKKSQFTVLFPHLQGAECQTKSDFSVKYFTELPS